MNKSPILVTACLTVACALSAQPVPPTGLPPSGLPRPVVRPGESATPSSAATENFPKFDLDFPGGRPSDLARMIREATHNPLNVIIPAELENTPIPALKLKNVTVPQLFEALEQASRKVVPQATGTYTPGYGGMQPQFSMASTSYGFKTARPTPDCIWHFYHDRPAALPNSPPAPASSICRFYQLESYLNQGLKIEDITTALETAWKMLGEDSIPKLKFHQDTTLLIAVGQTEKLALIDQVLAQLPGGQSPMVDPATGLPRRPGPMTPMTPGSKQRTPEPLKPQSKP